MKTTDQHDISLPFSPHVSQSESPTLMPGEFAGMYQAGFESGYEKGREAGYRQGFGESMAAVQEGPDQQGLNNDNRAVQQSAVKGKSALKLGPRRMLLGMPCER